MIELYCIVVKKKKKKKKEDSHLSRQGVGYDKERDPVCDHGGKCDAWRERREHTTVTKKEKKTRSTAFLRNIHRTTIQVEYLSRYIMHTTHTHTKQGGMNT